MSPSATPGGSGLRAVDLHAHPSLKTTLWRLDLARRHRSGGAWNPFTLRVDLPKLREGGVGVVVSSVYLPEKGLLEECAVLRAARALAPSRIRDLFGPDPLKRTLGIMESFEAAVRRATMDGQEVARVARSKSELDAALADGRIAVLHAIEGAHSLGADPGNAALLFERGVCMITIAHFFENDFVAPVHGIPRAQRPLRCFRKEKDLSRGLTAKGAELVEAMVDLGILLDLAHCTPRAREQVFEIVGTRRPLLFSHVGVRALKEDPMSPTDDEIRRVATTGGVIGIIFMSSWLSDTPHKNGLEEIVATARHIRNAGGIGAVALGTDFDGFTDPPDDAKDPADLPRVADALAAGGFSAAEVDAVLSGNGLRILHDGWGRA